MSAPNPKRQKEGWAKLDRIFLDAENVWIIHYSCESFYDRPEGHSPRITSIALRKLSSAQTTSFSIHQVAERQHVPFGEIERQYDALERQMLEEFFAHIGAQRGMKYLHWNMRNANYGFAAIEHRFRVLGGVPYAVEEDKKYDLSRLLIDIYGDAYIGHKRLEKLIEKNNITLLDFMGGAEEAEAFEKRNFSGLHQSTLRKVDILTHIASLAQDRSLKVDTSRWEMHGGRVRTAANWVVENKGIAFAASLASIAGLGWVMVAALFE